MFLLGTADCVMCCKNLGVYSTKQRLLTFFVTLVKPKIKQRNYLQTPKVADYTVSVSLSARMSSWYLRYLSTTIFLLEQIY